MVGRRVPTDKDPKPALYKMEIYAPSVALAKSRFWYFVSKLKKLKAANGEILSVSQVC